MAEIVQHKKFIIHNDLIIPDDMEFRYFFEILFSHGAIYSDGVSSANLNYNMYGLYAHHKWNIQYIKITDMVINSYHIYRYRYFVKLTDYNGHNALISLLFYDDLDQKYKDRKPDKMVMRRYLWRT